MKKTRCVSLLFVAPAAGGSYDQYRKLKETDHIAVIGLEMATGSLKGDLIHGTVPFIEFFRLVYRLTQVGAVDVRQALLDELGE